MLWIVTQWCRCVYVTHWVFHLQKNFTGSVMPPGQRPTLLRPSPAPSNPAPPRRRTPRTQWAPHPVGQEPHPAHPVPQWVRVQEPHPVGQWVNRVARGIPGKTGETVHPVGQNQGSGIDDDKLPFRAGKAKRIDFFHWVFFFKNPRIHPLR